MFWLIIILIVLPFFLFIKPYNNAQALAQRAKSNYSKIKSGVAKKVELVNQLIEIVKGYGDHEKLIYVKVSEDFATAYKQAASTLVELKSLSMNYPELKADKMYSDLMNRLTEIENDILKRRDAYNDATEAYNSARLQMPFVLVSNMLGFKELEYLDLDNEQEIKQFKTDDGEILREFLKTSSSKVGEVTKKGASKLAEATKKGMDKVSHLKEDEARKDDEVEVTAEDGVSSKNEEE